MADDARIQALAEEFDRFYQTHEPERGATDISDLTLAEAYSVQDRFLAARAARGAIIAGWKVGCTSPAIQKQFGLSQPISGRLLKVDIVASGSTLPAARFANCSVEAELVFRLGADIDAEMDEHQILECLNGVSAGIELHNYFFRYGSPTQQELVASNGIHAGLVLQNLLPVPVGWDIRAENVSLAVNGRIRATATCGEAMGGPLRSIRWLAQHAEQLGHRLRAGELVIPGSAAALVPVSAGDSVEALFPSLVPCQLTFV